METLACTDNAGHLPTELTSNKRTRLAVTGQGGVTLNPPTRAIGAAGPEWWHGVPPYGWPIQNEGSINATTPAAAMAS